ncbi:MAG: hypothetical protein IH845_01905 [Nanoarchaeota archaeon]|nr:hypothetical protein [Nanoarchaeota archaeon]
MANNFTYHKVNESEKEEIRKESKTLLEKFGKKLEKISSKEGHFERGSGFREEGSGWTTDQEFKDLTLLNAPFVEDNFIVAEKGSWKK